MAISRSRRLTAAVFAAAGAFTLLGTAGAVAAPAPPAGPVRAAHQPDSGIAPLCIVMPQTQGCENGPIQK
jgi:hypothetical protein